MDIKFSIDSIRYLDKGATTVLGFRQRVSVVLGSILVPFLFPFAVNSFIQGRIILGTLTALIVLLALISACTVYRMGRLVIPFAYTYFVMLFTLAWSIATVGTAVIFWCYPFAFSVLFISKQSEERILIGIAMALLVPCAFIYLPPSFAIRFAITYIMVCYFGDQVLSLLNDLQTQLTSQALSDSLTGVYNRRHMQTCLSNAVEEHRRCLNAVSLIALDVDHFKKINDSYGHEAGDTALINLVKVLQRRTRKLDQLFRIGGDEFVVLTRNISPEQAEVFAENLRALVEQSLASEKSPLTISLGVAHYENSEDINTWLKRADLNLYQAKRQGRNQVYPKPE